MASIVDKHLQTYIFTSSSSVIYDYFKLKARGRNKIIPIQNTSVLYTEFKQNFKTIHLLQLSYKTLSYDGSTYPYHKKNTLNEYN